MEIVAYRCVWDGEPGWMQYHDKTDPLPDHWDDDEHPDEVAALVLKIDADIEIDRLQARIDALMLEHCPDEMTPEQIANWERHQKAVPNARVQAAAEGGRACNDLLGGTVTTEKGHSDGS